MDAAITFKDLHDGLAKGGSLIMLSEYDGALTPFMSDPGAPRPSRETMRVLRRLARSPRVRMGAISGRSLRDLRDRLSVPGMIYAGCHGLEVSGRRLRFEHPEAAARRPRLEVLARSLRERVRSIRGAKVEAKGLAVAVHYRHVAAGAVPLVIGEVEQVVTRVAARPPAARLRIVPGNRVLEIVPDVGWDRGDCALWIWTRLAPSLPRPVMMLYTADDWTDESAFKALAGRGVTVRVGTREESTVATYRLTDVWHLLHLLSALAEESGLGGAR